MIGHVLAEVVLAMATLFIGSTWWQLRKRARFLKKAISDQPYLDVFISKPLLLRPPTRIEPYLSKNPIGYFVNIDVVVKADQSAQRFPKVLSSICLLLILGVSFYLGYPYLAINSALLGLLGFSPIHEPAKENALEQILTLAVILYLWRAENSAECDNWIAKVRSLQKLYAAVQKAG